MSTRIDDLTLAILSRVTVKGNTIVLTCGQLERTHYLAVNKILEAMGGKWNRTLKAHVFDGDPTDRLEHVLLTGEITQPHSFGYFPTPPVVAKTLIAMAEIRSGMSILEPSAGQGGIADHLPAGCRLECIELLPENVAVLQHKGYAVTAGDFLAMRPTPVYDRVIMNPPFERQADISHVTHAWGFVAPGGTLAAIMSAGVLFRENRNTLEFRRLVEAHGVSERLPEGSFKASGTGVNTCMVVLTKPA